jgi:hypothetical protein
MKMRARLAHPLLGLAALTVAFAGTAHANPLDRSYPQAYRTLRADYKRHLGDEKWKAFKATELEQVSMRGRWDKEDKAGFTKDGREREPVTYLRTPEARAPYKVRIGQDGKLYSGDKLLDTDGELAMMVMDHENQHYAPISRSDTREKNLKHSSFLAGDPVAMGYEAVVKRGVLIRVTNRSGHYRPSRERFMRWLVHLESQGVDMEQLDVEFDPKSQ